MLRPDKYFKENEYHFPLKNRSKARILFRRAVRDFYVMQSNKVIDPITGFKVESVMYGKFIKKQKSQNRIVERIFKNRKTAGRPPKVGVELLVARLFILWGQHASSSATISWKNSFGISTQFEDFLKDLLPRLGAPDVRRYVEAHWKERK